MGFQGFYYRISGSQDLARHLAVPLGRETKGFDDQRIERPTVPIVHLNFVQGSQIPARSGNGCQLLWGASSKLASNPDCTFARSLEGVGLVCGAVKFPKLIPGSARGGGSKPGSYAYPRHPAKTGPKRPIPVYVARFWYVFAIL